MRRQLALAMALVLIFAAQPALARHGCYGSWSGISFGVGPGFGYGYGPYGGCYGGGYGFSRPYYGGFNPYGIYYSPYSGYSSYYLPPVFAPAELLYGPRAVQQFWGLNPQPLVIGRGDRDRMDEPRARVTNAEYRRKADQFLAQGDRLFREQKFSQALDRYKQAAELAPDLAEAQWRKGHAYLAVHRYELAAAFFKRAIALNPDVARGDFNLSQLYGAGALVKNSHLEALAGETLIRSENPDLYFLLGIFLRYDGQAARAEKFFARAAELAGPDAAHLAAFLTPKDAVPVVAKELET